MAKKNTKKELIRPDSFQLALTRTAEFISENKSKIYIGSGVIVLILLISAGWYFYRTNQENNAQMLYTKAHIATLKGRLAGGQMDESALKLYQDVISKYPGTKAAFMANYRRANHYYRMNDIESSIMAYQSFIKVTSADSELSTLAHIGLGYCYESKKDFKNALESFENAANTKSSDNFESINLRNIARIHEELNNREKAIEYYQKALNKSVDPSVQQLIKRKISSLG
jgi:predicted negative regulator of RcsB-dependent stress response